MLRLEMNSPTAAPFLGLRARQKIHKTHKKTQMDMMTYWENERRKLLGLPLLKDNGKSGTALDAPDSAVAKQAGEEIAPNKHFVWVYDVSGLLRVKMPINSKSNEIFIATSGYVDSFLGSLPETAQTNTINGCTTILNLAENLTLSLLQNLENNILCRVGNSTLRQLKQLAETSNEEGDELGYLLYFESLPSKYPKQILCERLEFILGDKVTDVTRAPAAFGIPNESLSRLTTYINQNDSLRDSYLGVHIIGFGHTHPIGAAKTDDKQNAILRTKMTYLAGNSTDDRKPYLRNYEFPDKKGRHIAIVATELAFNIFPTNGPDFSIGYPFHEVQNTNNWIFDYSKKLIFDGNPY